MDMEYLIYASIMLIIALFLTIFGKKLIHKYLYMNEKKWLKKNQTVIIVAFLTSFTLFIMELLDYLGVFNSLSHILI